MTRRERLAYNCLMKMHKEVSNGTIGYTRTEGYIKAILTLNKRFQKSIIETIRKQENQLSL